MTTMTTRQDGAPPPAATKTAAQTTKTAPAAPAVKLNAQAKCELAFCHLYGYRGLAVNQQKALQLFLDAAHEGLPSAQHMAGVCYAQGLGVSRPCLQRALAYTLLAAEHHTKDHKNNSHEKGLAHLRQLMAQLVQDGARGDENAIRVLDWCVQQGHVHKASWKRVVAQNEPIRNALHYMQQKRQGLLAAPYAAALAATQPPPAAPVPAAARPQNTRPAVQQPKQQSGAADKVILEDDAPAAKGTNGVMVNGDKRPRNSMSQVWKECRDICIGKELMKSPPAETGDQPHDAKMPAASTTTKANGSTNDEDHETLQTLALQFSCHSEVCAEMERIERLLQEAERAKRRRAMLQQLLSDCKQFSPLSQLKYELNLLCERLGSGQLSTVEEDRLSMQIQQWNQYCETEEKALQRHGSPYSPTKKKQKRRRSNEDEDAQPADASTTSPNGGHAETAPGGAAAKAPPATPAQLTAKLVPATAAAENLIRATAAKERPPAVPTPELAPPTTKPPPPATKPPAATNATPHTNVNPPELSLLSCVMEVEENGAAWEHFQTRSGSKPADVTQQTFL